MNGHLLGHPGLYRLKTTGLRLFTFDPGKIYFSTVEIRGKTIMGIVYVNYFNQYCSSVTSVL